MLDPQLDRCKASLLILCPLFCNGRMRNAVGGIYSIVKLFMAEIATFELVAVDKPICDLVTKFGGQPVWHSEPEWPISQSLKIPMQFICQIKLEERLFGQTVGRMAYIFMTNEPGSGYTEDPEGGENAVIIQPGNHEALCEPISNGPTLFYIETRHEQKKAWIGLRDEYFDVEVPCEFAVELTYEQEMDAEGFAHLKERGGDQCSEVELRMDRSKLGGTPIFVQSDDWPFGRPTPLLLQLKSDDVPFFEGVEGLGGAEFLYVFLSDDGSLGRMLVQGT